MVLFGYILKGGQAIWNYECGTEPRTVWGSEVYHFHHSLLLHADSALCIDTSVGIWYYQCGNRILCAKILFFFMFHMLFKQCSLTFVNLRLWLQTVILQGLEVIDICRLFAPSSFGILEFAFRSQSVSSFRGEKAMLLLLLVSLLPFLKFFAASNLLWRSNPDNSASWNWM